MGLVINRAQGNSGRAAAGFDYYSGLMFYGTAPSVSGKWATATSPLFPSVTIKAQQMFAATDATSAGILPNTDNTAATFTAVISTKGNTGDTFDGTFVIPILGGGTQVIDTGLYTVGSSDTTIALQGAAWAAIINANTYLTGFSASFLTATLTLTCPKNLGVYPNSGTPLTITTTGAAVVASPALGVSGTASQYAIWFYHISEYFRMNPTGNLWVGVISATSSFNEILALKSASGNLIRQIGVYDKIAISTNMAANTLAIQTAALLIDQTFPFEVIYSPNIKAVSDLSTLYNGQLVSYNKVSVIISQDGLAQGNLLYTVSGQTIGNIGAKLGTLSSSRVSADDSQAIDQFNLSNGVENAIPAFGNGQLLSAISSTLNTELQLFRYIFFQVFTGNLVGTWWTDNYCFCVQTSDYAYENDNRVIDKIVYTLNQVYTPLLKSEVIYNQDGTISASSIESLQDAGVDGITASMITGQIPPTISGTPVVTIDPTQPLQATNNLQIVVSYVENGIARNITITVGASN